MGAGTEGGGFSWIDEHLVKSYSRRNLYLTLLSVETVDKEKSQRANSSSLEIIIL